MWRDLGRVVLAAACGLTACASPSPRRSKPVHATAPSGPEERARLVVVIVIDQMPSWAFEKYLPHLPQDGAIRRGVATGAYYPKVEYGYATTLTGPGHAAIATGAPPAISGALSNSVMTDQGRRPAVADGKHIVFGNETATASPVLLRVDTIGDAWRKQTNNAAKLVALSMKDRAAILSGGRRANLALWFDKKARRFTTSSYYAESSPSWLDAWQEAHPIKDFLGPWIPAQPELYERVNGPDDQPGELDWMGFGKTFPHHPLKAKNPYKMFCVTPRSTELLFDLAKTTVEKLELGADEVPDLLTVSVSSTDYAGHSYGPGSWEYFDNLIAADRALTSFLSWLEARQPIAVLLTSDHGVAPLPERNSKGGRVFAKDVRGVAEAAVTRILGEGVSAIASLGRPFVRLTETAKRGPHRKAVVAAIKKALEATPAIHAVYDIEALIASKPSGDPIEPFVRASVSPSAPGDLYVVMAEGWVIDEGRPRGGGTAHGSPWPYDRIIPVVVWGSGVRSVHEPRAVEQSRVAPTVAALLGSEVPAHVVVAPLDVMQSSP